MHVIVTWDVDLLNGNDLSVGGSRGERIHENQQKL